MLAARSFLPIPHEVWKPNDTSFRLGIDMETKMTQLLTVQEFKDRYSISHSAFYREVAAKRIPIRKIGRSTRIAVADAEAWAASLPTSTD